MPIEIVHTGYAFQASIIIRYISTLLCQRDSLFVRAHPNNVSISMQRRYYNINNHVRVSWQGKANKNVHIKKIMSLTRPLASVAFKSSTEIPSVTI